MGARTPQAMVVAAFATFGVFWGAWGAALPQIQRSARVSSGTLGLDLLLIGVGAICAMRLAGTLVDRLGPLVLPASMVALAAVGVLPTVARSGFGLGAAALVLGAVSGAYDVAINTAGARSEAVTSRPIMNVAHAGFSIGVVITSLSVGVALDRGATPLGVFVGGGVVTAAVAGVLAALRHALPEPRPALIRSSPPEHDDSSAGPGPDSNRRRADSNQRRAVSNRRRRVSIPRPLLILGAICGLGYFVEGAWQSWGAVHIERTFHGSPALGASAPAIFALAAAVGRLSGQRVARRVAARAMLWRGASLAAAGTALAAAAPDAALALIGVGLAGLGTSICAPTVFSLTGQIVSPERRGAAVGTVTTLAYVGFVLGPALVGVVTSAAGLRTALGLVGLVAVSLALLAPQAPVPAGRRG